ncbi:NADH:flavin oxidoreductase [Haloferax sp. DFSO52]|uniref:oxidoreductase n=1 Tax=Haloferax sp. DFSO52 TaxID=3388505 RepID=UPI003A8662EC
MASIRLDDPVEIGGLTLRNRLYRAPLLECAGNGDGAPARLAAELEPAAQAGAGLVCQGATIVSETGGCAAPGMTRVADDEFVESLKLVTDRIHDSDAAIAIQLEHGGLRSMETWHAGYRRDHPNLQQLAVSRPPRLLRLLDALGFLDYDAHVLTTEEVYELAADFGRSAALAVDAGYDVVHIAGANMGIVHQFLSPFYNRRDDEFGDGVRFLEVVADEIRAQAGDVPLMTKIPAETAAPPGLGPHLTVDDAVDICHRLADGDYDALVPVSGSVFWDASIVRGSFPADAWNDDRYRDGYADAFGGPLRARLVELGNRVESMWYEFEPAWNAELCRRVRDAVSVPVFCEGGIRERGQIDALLGESADAVGMARPFYAEPELPARLLGTDVSDDTRVVCESCNNCAVPQVTGAPGVCRTSSVLRRAGTLKKEGAYADETEFGGERGNDPVG